MRLKLFKRKKVASDGLPGVVRIRLEESRLSAANVGMVRERYLPQVHGQKCLVLELDRLRFLDSSGLGLLVGLRNALLSPQMVVLEGIVDPSLLELLRLTRMDQVFFLSSQESETNNLLSSIKAIN